MRSQTAATGAVAMVSSDPQVALRIADTVLTSTLVLDDEEDDDDVKKEERTYTRNGRQVLRDLVRFHAMLARHLK